MSEKCAGERETRRPSFRKMLAESDLPQDQLERLEQKRKQLDESIHKYIAAKEREYRNYEKDLKQQHRATRAHDGANGVIKRRSSSASAPDAGEPDGRRRSAADSLTTNGARREWHGDAAIMDDDDAIQTVDRSLIAGLKDRRASADRDKDFVGLFTPPFLLALDGKNAPPVEHTSSAPVAFSFPSPQEMRAEEASLHRSNSDTAVRAKAKRPSHLSLVYRQSSSGSSVDGKLASALKSPTQQPKRKRVSLAVGDTIVAPSDSVPVALTHRSSSSHSRTRSRAADRERYLPAKEAFPQFEQSATVPAPALAHEVKDFALLPAPLENEWEDPHNRSSAPITIKPTNSPKMVTPVPIKIDPDGDLFDLEAEELDIVSDHMESDGSEDTNEIEHEITGRIQGDDVGHSTLVGSPDLYDPEGGLVLPTPETPDESAVEIDFGNSEYASQQPTQPGFRRPSVVHDPIVRGANYEAAERHAVEDDIYGSSYSRVASKGSFVAGTLGESFMEKNAEQLLKIRTARQREKGATMKG